jgi:subtilisin-like proprotein convertase family protein/WD40 repeat protein
MSSVVDPAEFFVVGGPVDPERRCYVLRAADAALAVAVRGRRLCCVLGPPATGKTSLLLRAAHALPESGARAVFVPLKLLDATTRPMPLAIAAHVATALELDIDVETWWRAAEPRVGESRLVEFFAQVVLTSTSQPVLVFHDDVETLLDRPGRVELLDAIIGCYARRDREPGFARLGFVLAGCTSLRPLLGGVGHDAASIGVQVVEPADFSSSEAYRLAVAFGGEPAHAQALMDRIHAWTGGHPYFTQKVARGVARKGGRLEDVERVVRADLLAADVASTDIALAPMRARLRAPIRSARRAARLVRRLGAGGRIGVPPDAAVGDELRLAGAALPEDGGWRVRNRIVKELAAAGWLRPARSAIKLAAVAALGLVALAGAAYWYARYLPEADIATLTSATAAPSAVEDAYRRLRALPGFAERADGLWQQALMRQSRAATSLAEALPVDALLRVPPGDDGVADGLLGEFWLRKARAARFAEQRDAALLFAQRAAQLPVDAARASAELAELVGEDYALLERSLRLPTAPASWQLAATGSLLLTFDAEQRLSRLALDAAAGDAPPGAPVALTALRHSPLVRELLVEGERAAGDFELSVTVAHPATGELFVTLTAPSGAVRTVTLPSIAGEARETFVFAAERGTALGELAGEPRSGTWRLTLVDGSAGNAGGLVAWGLTFSETGPRDEPPEPVAIPDPARVEQVTLAIAGSRAVAWTATPGPVGSVALWNLTTGALEHDLALPAAPLHVALDASGTRVLAGTERALTLFDTASGAVVARVATQTEFLLPPVFSAEGAYVAIAERVDGARPLYSVLRSADGSFVTSFAGPSNVIRWELGLGAGYATFLGPANVVRVVAPRGGIEIERLVHAANVVRIAHLPGGMLVTVDAEARIAAWRLGDEGVSAPWQATAASPASIDVAPGAARLAYTRPDGAVSVLDARSGAELARLRQPRATPPTMPQLTSDGARLVTQSDTLLRLWSIPPGPAQPGADAIPSTVVGLDRGGDFAAVGFASGQVEFSGAALGPQDSLAFFGHRGAVTAAAVLEPLALAVTGGADGFVRLWDAASGAPTGAVVQRALEPIVAVALGPDGRYLASATGREVRVAGVADGVVTAEHAAAAEVTALALASDALVFGDAAGGVVVAPLAESTLPAPLATRIDSAVSALAFASAARRLAVGGAGGHLKVIGTDDGAELAALRLPAAVRFVDFGPEGHTLLVATDTWLHAFELERGLQPLASRIARLPRKGVVFAPASSTAVWIAGLDGTGMLERAWLDLAAAPTATASAGLVERDWSAVLGLRLDADGVPALFDP